MSELEQNLEKRDLTEGELLKSLQEKEEDLERKDRVIDRLLKENEEKEQALKKLQDMPGALKAQEEVLERRKRKLKDLSVERNELKKKNRELENQAAGLANRVEEMTTSTSWKLTRPVRFVSKSVRTVFSGKWLRKILRGIYRAFPVNMSFKLKVKGALFTALAPVLKNTKAYKDWKNYTQGIDITESKELQVAFEEKEKGDYVSQILNLPFSGKNPEYVEQSRIKADFREGDVRYLAFYLPQYHPFKENDEWWGKGFTEWTNVTKAVPQFVGHYQPRLAGELGYYDLRNPEIIKQQMELAKFYGIYGFCIYYYWFDGKKLMDTPLRLIMENPELDLPFCLCWANENWSRRWDGKEQDILIAQDYDEEFPEMFIKDIEPYLSDPRYIKVDGKPLLIIYNPNEIPDLEETIEVWRAYCRKQGIGEIHLLAVDFSMDKEVKHIELDGFIEFPPHSVCYYNMETINEELTVADANYAGQIFDYREIVRQKQYLKRNLKNYYKGIFLGWDNTARKPRSATVYHRFSIPAFREWLEDITEFTIENRQGEDRLVFINAWNEWAEGTYLEPDRHYGYAALESVKETLHKSHRNNRKILYVGHNACNNGAQQLSLHIIEQLSKTFHYDVYVILGDGGVLLGEFRRYAAGLLCLNGEKPDSEELEQFVKRSGCRKAICNTVVSGNLLKALTRQGILCISLIHEMENVIRQYHCEENLSDIASCAEKIVFASEYVKKSAEKIRPLPEDKIVIAPQGIYKPNPYGCHNEEKRQWLREKFHLAPDTVVILGVGFGDHRKGMDLFLKIAQKVCEQEKRAAFLWLGEVEPQYEEEAQQIIRKNSYGDRILLAGPDSDVYRYYAGSDLFLLTSREDPFPTVVMEAMNAGLPVAAFRDGGGYVENITDKTGILAAMEDTEEMAQAILSLVQSEQTREEMGQNAFRYVSSRFDFISYLYRLLDLLGEHFEKVSAVIPNYNYAGYLRERINSVLQQDYPLLEVLLLDDKSTDDSLKIMKEYEKTNPLHIKVVPNEKNGGNVFKQWEKGCLLAKGDYIWIAEADDLSKTEFVSRLMERMEADKEISLAYTQSYMMNEKGCITQPNYLCYTEDVDPDAWKQDYVCDAGEEIKKKLAVKNTIPNVSAVIFQKRDFTEMFREAEKYHVAGDWAFYVKVLEKGGKAAFVAESLNYHRRHSNSVTTDLKVQTHYEEICRMQDYVRERHADEAEWEKALKYREELKKKWKISDRKTAERRGD